MLECGAVLLSQNVHAQLHGEVGADPEDVPVKRGDLLGYQGEYAGVGRPPIGMHVHMSIVTSEDDGTFRNEAIIGNTLDPSPYFGMQLHIADLPARPIQCKS